MIIHRKGLIKSSAYLGIMNFIAEIPKELWFTPTYKGRPYKYQMVNVGDYAWSSDPYGYSKNTNGLEIPERIKQFAYANGVIPEVMLINDYKPGATLGLHQDKDEESKAPIISISLGCSAIFVVAKTYGGERTSYLLENGDVLIMGGNNRMDWHGITQVHEDLDYHSRYNLTIRQVKV